MNRVGRTATCMTYVVVAVTLAACSGIAGVTGVGYSDDSPAMSWNEEKFADVYGPPAWQQALPDGRQVAYFEYNNAFDSTAWKAVSLVSHAMTLGMDDQIKNATSKRLAAVFEADGTAVCADRDPINLAMRCEKRIRHDVIAALSGDRRQTYFYLAVDIDPKEYAPRTFIVGPYHRDRLSSGVATLERQDETARRELDYYRDLFCYAAGRWYRRHLEEFRLHEQQQPELERLEELESIAYGRLAERGDVDLQAERDLGLVYDALQLDLDAKHLSRPRRLAQVCIAGTHDDAVAREIFGRIETALFERILEAKRLAQAIAMRDMGYPERTPAAFELKKHPPTSGVIGDSREGMVFGDELRQLSFNSEPWLERLTARTEALRNQIFAPDLLIPMELVERAIRDAEEQGLEPVLTVPHTLSNHLSHAVVVADFEAAVSTMTALGRYYMTGEPYSVRYDRAGGQFMAAAFVAHRMQQFDRSAGLALLSSDGYLAAVQAKLAEHGIGNVADRDRVRELLDAQPARYSYRDSFGSLHLDSISAPTLADPDGFLEVSRELDRLYQNANFVLGYALPFATDRGTAAQYLERLGAKASETFAPGGANYLFFSAATAWRGVSETKYHETRFESLFAMIRLNGSQTRFGSRKLINSCERHYFPARRELIEFVGGPDYDAVESVFGERFRKRLKDYDGRCKVKPKKL